LLIHEAKGIVLRLSRWLLLTSYVHGSELVRRRLWLLSTHIHAAKHVILLIRWLLRRLLGLLLPSHVHSTEHVWLLWLLLLLSNHVHASKHVVVGLLWLLCGLLLVHEPESTWLLWLLGRLCCCRRCA